MEKLFVCITERAESDDEKTKSCHERLKTLNKNDFLTSNYSYHADCHKNCTNKTEIKRCKERFQKKLESSNTGSNDIIENEVSVSESHQLKSRNSLRSSVPLYDKDACITSQKEEGTMHTVSFKATGEKMLEVAEKLTDRSFFYV